MRECNECGAALCCGKCGYYPLDILDDQIASLEKELEKYKQACERAKKTLRELGHYGIDFGYGEYRCNVAEEAQQALNDCEVILKE